MFAFFMVDWFKKDEKVPSVPDNVWENPWYPLSGPPTTPEEELLLQNAINLEQEQVQKALGLKFRESNSIKSELENASRSNCADLELKWVECLKSFSLDRFLTMCDSCNQDLKECMGIQKRNLIRLKFERAFHENSPDLEKIIEKADEMYLHEQQAKEKR